MSSVWPDGRSLQEKLSIEGLKTKILKVVITLFGGRRSFSTTLSSDAGHCWLRMFAGVVFGRAEEVCTRNLSGRGPTTKTLIFLIACFGGLGPFSTTLSSNAGVG